MVRFNRARRGLILLVAVAALVGTRTLAQGPAPGGAVRTDISGDWAVVSNEDQPHRGPGPELGDYTGLPINPAKSFPYFSCHISEFGVNAVGASLRASLK